MLSGMCKCRLQKSFKAFFILGYTSVGVYAPFIYWGEGRVHIYMHMHITESFFKAFFNLRMSLWWSLCTLHYLLVCQLRVTVSDSGLCYCIYVTLRSTN